MKTKCNYCGEESDIQSVGNGCHSCLRGSMQDNEEESESNHIRIDRTNLVLTKEALEEGRKFIVGKWRLRNEAGRTRTDL